MRIVREEALRSAKDERIEENVQLVNEIVREKRMDELTDDMLTLRGPDDSLLSCSARLQ